jgi:uncharacterized protein YlzI (FlbEa/FlbD family)
MMKLTKFSGEEFWVNPDTLKYIEDGGDTIVYLINGERLLVQEKADEIRSMFLNYKKEILQGIAT